MCVGNDLTTFAAALDYQEASVGENFKTLCAPNSLDGLESLDICFNEDGLPK